MSLASAVSPSPQESKLNEVAGMRNPRSNLTSRADYDFSTRTAFENAVADLPGTGLGNIWSLAGKRGFQYLRPVKKFTDRRPTQHLYRDLFQGPLRNADYPLLVCNGNIGTAEDPQLI